MLVYLQLWCGDSSSKKLKLQRSLKHFMVKLPLLKRLASCFTNYKSFPSALKCMRDQNIRISADSAFILVQSTEILHVQNVPPSPIMQACNELVTFFMKVTTVRTASNGNWSFSTTIFTWEHRFSDDNKKHLINFARGKLSTSSTSNLYLDQSSAPVSSLYSCVVAYFYGVFLFCIIYKLFPYR